MTQAHILGWWGYYWRFGMQKDFMQDWAKMGKALFDWKAFATAVICTGSGFAVRALLDPLLKNEMDFTFFWMAAVVAMWRQGTVAAFLTALLGFGTAEYFFVAPRHSFQSFPSDLLAVAVVYFGVCFVACLLVNRIALTERKLQRLVGQLEEHGQKLEHEVQERSSAITSLQKSETLLRDVLRALPVGVWILNQQGQIVETNPMGLQVWGGARFVGPDQYHEFKGRYLHSTKPIAAQEWAAARAISRGDTSLNEEIEIEAFDGLRKIILNSAIPLRENGKIIGAIIVNQDITERKKHEGELQKAKELLENHSRALEAQVAERTAHLHQTIHSLEGMIYHIAHDLRSPLRAMQGFSTLLLNNYAPKLDEMAREYLFRVAEGATRMDSLIQDLLTYGRVAREEIGDERIQLKLLLEECIDELRKEIASRQAMIRIDQPLPELRSSRSLLHKIFCALLSNAIRFSRPGVPPEVRVYASNEAGWWRICVSDNGVGIEPFYQRKIFQIFETIPTNETSPGSGIGLAITQKAVQRLGGKIGVESEPGKGSCFWVDLPAQPPIPSQAEPISGRER